MRYRCKLCLTEQLKNKNIDINILELNSFKEEIEFFRFIMYQSRKLKLYCFELERLKESQDLLI
jgi:hypothetical protein